MLEKYFSVDKNECPRFAVNAKLLEMETGAVTNHAAFYNRDLLGAATWVVANAIGDSW